MIADLVECAGLYHSLHPALEQAFAFLERDDLMMLPEGRHAIDGDRVFAVVANGPGRPRAEARLEVHDAYIDVHCVLAGTELLGWSPRASCGEWEAPFDAGRDVGFFLDEPKAWLHLDPGHFALFLPEDAHMPLASEAHVHKVILKIAVEKD